MLNLFRSLVPNPFVRACILKGARWAGAMVGGYAATWLVKHGASADDADIVKDSLLTLATAGGSIVFSLLDAKTVDTNTKAVQVDTAKAVLTAAGQGPQALQSVGNAVAAGPVALRMTVDALNKGTF